MVGRGHRGRGAVRAPVPTLAQSVVPAIAVSPSVDLADGATVEVVGDGFTPSQGVIVQLCRTGSEGTEFDSDCDRDWGQGVAADPNSTFHRTLVVHGSFESVDPIPVGGSVDCRHPPGCEVIAHDLGSDERGRAPVTFGPPPPSRGRYLDPVFADAAVTRDIAYRETTDARGNPVTLRLDIWQPRGDTAAARPAIVWMHGGYFIFGQRSDMDSYALAFARRGYVALSLQYRLRPDLSTTDAAGIHAAALDAYDDATAAVEWLKAHAADYRIDTDNVAAGGYSAGPSPPSTSPTSPTSGVRRRRRSTPPSRSPASPTACRRRASHRPWCSTARRTPSSPSAPAKEPVPASTTPDSAAT